MIGLTSFILFASIFCWEMGGKSESKIEIARGVLKSISVPSIMSSSLLKYEDISVSEGTFRTDSGTVDSKFVTSMVGRVSFLMILVSSWSLSVSL